MLRDDGALLDMLGAARLVVDFRGDVDKGGFLAGATIRPRRSRGAGAAAMSAAVVLAFPAVAAAGWTLQSNGTGQNQGFFGISAWDADHAMAVGVRDTGGGNSEAVVAVTSDGGASWTQVRPMAGPPGPFAIEMYLAVEMTSARQAYVGALGRLYVTSDGGATWTHYAETEWGPMRGPLVTGVSFADESTGFFVGSAGLVRKTTDGGAAWTPTDAPVPDVDHGGVLALGAGRVWLWAGSAVEDPSTGEVTGYEDGMLARSTDGGATWTTIFRGETRSVMRVFMLNATEGWMLSASMAGPRLERTTNGGAAWSEMAIPEGTGGAPDAVLDVFFFDRCEGFLLAERNEQTRLFYTTDRGAAWNQVDLSGLRIPLPFPFPVYPRLIVLDFPSRDVGWAGGMYESLARYEADGPGPSCGGGGDGGNGAGSDAGSCGCRAAGRSSPIGAGLALAAVAALAATASRRRCPCSGSPSGSRGRRCTATCSTRRGTP